MGLVDCLPMAWLGLVLVFESPWQLTTCHKAFVVSETHIHFGCRGDQSAVGTTDSCFVLVRTHQCRHATVTKVDVSPTNDKKPCCMWLVATVTQKPSH